MNASTGSFRLADVRSSAIARLTTTAGNAPVAPTERIAELVGAVIDAVPTLGTRPSFPALATAAKFVQNLTRPVLSVRSATEELADERLNTLTHGLGFALSAAGVLYLLAAVAATGGWLRMAGCGVYGASLVLMYAASTCFHFAQQPHVKRRWRLCDHVAIYLLIAGTYTPLFASLMAGYVGFTMLAFIWALAAVGIAIKVKYAERLDDTSPLPCLGLGWIGLAAMKPMLEALPPGFMALILAGGVSYSAGVIFYFRDDKQYFHAIWHLFVMAGTAFHFCAILHYVAE